MSSYRPSKTQDIMRRRCQLIVLLQHQPHTVDQIAELMEYPARQVRRDRDWLRDNGVPVKVSGLTESREQLLTIDRRFRAERWLWALLTG